jgi:predicted AlkP superfamily pyrophosphatase or phosphodiesterase
MKRLIPWAIVALGACAADPTAPPAPPNDRLVVLISIDGLPADYLSDPRVHLPTLRRLAQGGAAAQGMRCVFPTVTWPNHTTLVTGVPPAKHGVLANRYFDRESQTVVPLVADPVFDKDQIVKVPTIYDLAHQAGLATAGIVWPATRNAKTLDWTVPDCGTQELWDKFGTAAWMEELRKEGIWVDMQEPWHKAGAGVQRDWMYAKAAAQVIRAHRPNLVLLHLIELDHVQHTKGPRTPDAYWASSYEDDRVREVLEAVEASGRRDRATVFVVSDHGFLPYSKSILPNVLLRKAGFLSAEADKITARRAYAVTLGGAAFVYLLDPDHRPESLGKLRTMFQGLEGVKAVLEPRDCARWGIATADQDPRMGDLILSAQDGYSFSDKVVGEEPVADVPAAGSHGYLPDDPRLLATFIAWGAQIRPGTRLGLMDNTDVAPTVASLLGLRMANVDGRVRDEILLPR